MNSAELAEEFQKRKRLLVSLFLGNGWATIRKRGDIISVQFSDRPCEPVLAQVRLMFSWNGKSWEGAARATLQYPLEQLIQLLLARSWRIGNAQA